MKQIQAHKLILVLTLLRFLALRVINGTASSHKSLGTFEARLETNPGDVEALDKVSKVAVKSGAWTAQHTSRFVKAARVVSKDREPQLFRLVGLAIFAVKQLADTKLKTHRRLSQPPVKC